MLFTRLTLICGHCLIYWHLQFFSWILFWWRLATCCCHKAPLVYLCTDLKGKRADQDAQNSLFTLGTSEHGPGSQQLSVPEILFYTERRSRPGPFSWPWFREKTRRVYQEAVRLAWETSSLHLSSHHRRWSWMWSRWPPSRQWQTSWCASTSYWRNESPGGDRVIKGHSVCLVSQYSTTIEWLQQCYFYH